MGTSGSKPSYESVSTGDHRAFDTSDWHLSSDDTRRSERPGALVSSGDRIAMDLAMYQIQEDARREREKEERLRREKEKEARRKEEAAAGRDTYGFNFNRTR